MQHYYSFTGKMSQTFFFQFVRHEEFEEGCKASCNGYELINCIDMT